MTEAHWYALIDRYTQQLAWVGPAESAEVACATVDSEQDPGRPSRRFERVESSSVDDGFDVYAVPTDAFLTANGSDPGVVRAVRACSPIGIFNSLPLAI